jgi:RNA polymerase sigma factor (TIGR02999 family)
MSDVTPSSNSGEPPRQAGDLLPLVYDELRKLAAVRMANEPASHTLDPTALVHEAYLRLADRRAFANKAHFFAAAAEAMRRILVDHARARNAQKRQPGATVSLDVEQVPGPGANDDVLAVDESLTRLGAREPRVAELVQLRYFGGLTISEAASALEISPRTADAWWAYARAWLATDLAGR